MKRRDLTTTLTEIQSFCKLIFDRIERYQITEDSIATDADHADLILMPLCQIGESVQRSRDELESTYPEIPWHKIAGLRNVIVHGYMDVDATIVYATVKNDIPNLNDFCNSVLN